MRERESECGESEGPREISAESQKAPRIKRTFEPQSHRRVGGAMEWWGFKTPETLSLEDGF